MKRQDGNIHSQQSDLNWIGLLVWGVLLFFLPGALGANPIQRQKIEIELMAENEAVVPGESFWIALRLRPDPNWHTYWKNPGDGGVALRMQWKIPSGGAAVDEFQWPVPDLIQTGPIVSYGYTQEHMLLAQVYPSASLPAKRFLMEAKMAWAVCADICITDKTTIVLDLPVQSGPMLPVRNNKTRFEQARLLLPQPLNNYRSEYQITPDNVVWDIYTHHGEIQPGDQVFFFPEEADLVNHSARPTILVDENHVNFQQALSPYHGHLSSQTQGVLTIKNQKGTRAYRLTSNLKPST